MKIEKIMKNGKKTIGWIGPNRLSDLIDSWGFADTKFTLRYGTEFLTEFLRGEKITIQYGDFETKFRISTPLIINGPDCCTAAEVAQAVKVLRAQITEFLSDPGKADHVIESVEI